MGKDPGELRSRGANGASPRERFSPSLFVICFWQFASVNLSAAIAAVTENEGLFAAALLVAVEGYVWLAIAIPAAVSANKYYGSWTMVIMAFSYYWTHQVMTNVLAVGTAGTIGRWLVVGEGAPTVTTGLKVSVASPRGLSTRVFSSQGLA